MMRSRRSTSVRSRTLLRSFLKPRTAERERGAALVEFAVVVSLLILLVFGIYEMGTALKTSQSASQASRDGARVGSQLALRGETDYEILKAVEASLGTDVKYVSRVVIYEALNDGEMSASCEAATPGYVGSARCNVYGPLEMATLGAVAGPGWGSGTSCGVNDSNWCAPTDRNAGPLPANFTNLGISVELDKPAATQLFGTGPLNLSQHAVMKLEPDTR